MRRLASAKAPNSSAAIEHVIGDRVDTGTQQALKVRPFQDLLRISRRSTRAPRRVLLASSQREA